MTSRELNLLKAATGYGTTAIYRVAHIVGRIPYAWEVVYFAKFKGRTPKYPSYLFSPKLKAAWAVWKGIGHLREGFSLEYQDAHKALVDAVVREIQFYGLISELAPRAINSWIELYEGIPWESIQEGTHPKCFQAGQDLMLEVVMSLKSIINGG